jgi:hypothetical protein
MSADLERIFAAIAFAEENEHDIALNMLSNNRKEKSIFKTLGKKLGSFRKTVDKYQEQITFAQAGSFELIDEQPVEQKENRSSTLLVVGNEANFSDSIIEYAIEMAQRMSYSILALNTAPFTCNTMNLFSSQQKKLCNDFSELARKNVASFKEKAEENGIDFRHIIMFNSVDEAQEELFKERKDIAFVISNEIEDRAVHEQREGISNRIYVYSMN